MDSALQNMNPVLQMLTVMSLFSLLPFVFCCMTSFLRFTIVFSLLKTAMGVQVPPSIVTIGLCMILTFYTMGGVFEQMYQRGSVPYQKTQNLVVAIDEGSEPLKEFMLKQTRANDLSFFINLKRKTMPKSPEDITIWEIAPAYILSELKVAFEIGFVVFVPFIVLD
ncbi:EscR/YscR/HrcR family type III secretion system export apparatus protein, partial [bacterium]|nr:EscR/YscR/HrcR family type III secretion system export apparatus protein [bacterium]